MHCRLRRRRRRRRRCASWPRRRPPSMELGAADPLGGDQLGAAQHRAAAVNRGGVGRGKVSRAPGSTGGHIVPARAGGGQRGQGHWCSCCRAAAESLPQPCPSQHPTSRTKRRRRNPAAAPPAAPARPPRSTRAPARRCRCLSAPRCPSAAGGGSAPWRRRRRWSRRGPALQRWAWRPRRRRAVGPAGGIAWLAGRPWHRRRWASADLPAAGGGGGSRALRQVVRSSCRALLKQGPAHQPTPPPAGPLPSNAHMITVARRSPQVTPPPPPPQPGPPARRRNSAHEGEVASPA